MKPGITDSEARRQALDSTGSFIVQAPAGSGKTELLIQRYLKLLGGVQYPEQILAITFTRKAAGEMKSRILAALEKAQSGDPPESGHTRQTWNLARKALEQNRRNGWRLLDNPARLKVQTIDSFCASLTRQMPILSKMGGTLQIQENPAEIYRETAHRILRLVESGEPTGEYVRIVLRHIDNSKSSFLKRIIQLLEKRDQWMIPFFKNFQVTENFRQKLEEMFAGLIESVLQETRDLISTQCAQRLIPLAAHAGKNVMQENPGHTLACLDNSAGLPEPVIAHLDRWKAIAHLLLTGGGEFRKKIDKNIGFPPGKINSPEAKMKDAFRDFLDSLSGARELQARLRAVQKLPAPHFNDDEWNVLHATLMLLPEIAKTLRGVFAEQQKTDFTEISLAAIDALGEETSPTDLLLYLDHRIQHILMDEYQDTSYKQHELLKRLTVGWEPNDGRTLFIVGDPMQSIFRFRDAEVGLFLKTKRDGIPHEGTGDIHLTSLSLTANFRSQKKIVDWINAVFSQAFPSINDSDLGAIAYAESHAARPEEPGPGTVLHPLADSGTAETRARQEADRVANEILKIQKEHPDQSIALLIRARTHLPAIIQRFHETGIKFQAEEINPLTTRPAIQDLLALMRALRSPLDRISWLSVLRAPWCGLSLNDTFHLCAGDKDSPIWHLLNDPDRVAALSGEGQTLVGRFVSTLKPALEALPWANFRALLEGCWIRLGGPACVDETTSKDVEVFFDEVSNTIENGDPFLLDNFSRVLDHLYATPDVGAKHAVQIMTMHKAKGLEFDFVFLPGLGRSAKSEEKRLVHWMPHGNDILLAPIEEKGGDHSQVYDFLSGLDREKDDYETLRLLYVAATRARKQLHLFGHIKNGRFPEKNSLLAKLWPQLEEKWSLPETLPDPERTGAEQSPVEAAADAQNPDPKHTLHRLPLDFQIPDSPPDIVIGPVVEMEDEPDVHPEFVWAGNEARCLGNVLHQVFMDIANQGLDSWQPENLEARLASMKTAFLGEGLSPLKIDGVAETGLTALRNILQDETGRWILGHHEEAHSEYPLTGFINGRYVNKILDRTFVDQGIRWIIDYKTGQHLGSGLERFFEDETERYRPQLDQYQELLELKGESRPIKKALYYPLHLRLIEL
ncbi:MAG: UvrD-helicase domain-containing protein [Nitrospinaceae bacterium]